MFINVIGWYNERNTGDESFRMVFDQLFFDHDIVYSKHVNDAADRIVFGGGGVMCKDYLDNLGSRPAYAIGVDVALSGPHYERLRELNFKSIVIRSQQYARIAKERGWKEVSYAPDIALSLDYPNHYPVRNRIGIILTHELPIEKEKDILAFIGYLKKAGKDPVFIAMYDGLYPDSVTCRRISKDLPLHRNNSPLSVIRSIASCESIVSMRFHGSIFAAGIGVPFISLGNQGKHSLFCEQESLNDSFIDLKNLDFNALRTTYETKTSSYCNANNYDLLNGQILPEFKRRVLSNS